MVWVVMPVGMKGDMGSCSRGGGGASGRRRRLLRRSRRGAAGRRLREERKTMRGEVALLWRQSEGKERRGELKVPEGEKGG